MELSTFARGAREAGAQLVQTRSSKLVRKSHEEESICISFSVCAADHLLQGGLPLVRRQRAGGLVDLYCVACRAYVGTRRI